MKKTRILIAKYYLFGLIALFIFYIFIGEFPAWYTIKRDWIQWITTIISTPIIGTLISKYLSKSVLRKKERYFSISFFALFISWLFSLYTKALVLGILASIESGKIKIIEAIMGYTIYQLWIYLIFGIIHGVLGGYFLAKELRKLER